LLADMRRLLPKWFLEADHAWQNRGKSAEKLTTQCRRDQSSPARIGERPLFPYRAVSACLPGWYVRQATQHHQGNTGCGRVGPPHRFQSLCIGQPQVEQDHVHSMCRKMLLGIFSGRLGMAGVLANFGAGPRHVVQ
jgi:hypothetical protein